MKTIYTIGHSTRDIEEFIALLKEQGIERLVDIRRFPGSKRYPQFGKEALPRYLNEAGIAYEHVEALGGRRTPLPDSPNGFWRNAQFRAYADHMNTAEFQQALNALIERAGVEKQVVMCAEAVPWRCHRQLLADALVARGVRVFDIINAGKPSEHTLHKGAQVLEDGSVIYPPPHPPPASAQMHLL